VDVVALHLLRRATDGIVPDHLRLRKDKTGFSLPFDRWLEGDLGDFARDVLGSASFAARDIVDPGVARGLLEEHRAGRARHGMVIWQMLNMELWFREWIDPPEREVTLC
jgi:asparagine synthase (glutamine-hydrolysing)